MSDKRTDEDLAWKNKQGDGVRQNYHLSLEQLQEAARLGDADAQYRVGCHLYNEASFGDKDEALKWIEKAAMQGHADAQYKLGCHLFDGKGCATVIGIALVAIVVSSFFGLTFLGVGVGVIVFIAYRIEGKENKIEAVEWLQKAAKQGHADAKKKLENVR